MSFDSEYREDMFVGEEGHPQCCFFEAFDADPDPNAVYYAYFFCHITMIEEHAEQCKGDYIKCPFAYGRLDVLTTAKADGAQGAPSQTGAQNSENNKSKE